ncbi:MAG: T9SS type A sorting domain-containing protein, partial [Bacteroidales bacterium]|nr:T9SS type A sorting domain-containing protein [Bacteroidales bacterium]
YWDPPGEDASYSDSWYSCMDGPDDHYADLAIGRITYDNLGELELQMDKLMDHYFNPDVTTNWAENTILVAHKELYPDKYTLCKEQIRTFDYALQTPIFTECYGGAGANNDDIIEFVNSTSGGIFNYRGHGSATEFYHWGAQGSFTNSHIVQLTNENRLFVLFDVCCDNMDIVAHAGNCLCESFMKSPVAAIAINGAIIPSYTIPNHDYDKEMYKAIFQDGILNIGYITNFANVTVLNVHGTYGRSNVRTYLWLGDASLEPWTLQPAEMIVNHDAQLFLGLTEYEVTVIGSGGPVENALVCISNEEQTIYSVAYTDASGMAIVQFDEPVQDPGFAMVSVSSHNYLPYQAEIPVIPLEGPYIVRDEFFINDEAGNGNGLMDYGESILLSLSVKNVGLEDATNVTVTLSSDDEYVTITTATADYGTVPAEESVMVEDAFAFDVADNLPDGHFVLFDIIATDGNETWISKITIPGYAPFLEIGGMDILDLTGNNNGRLDPGETADILITTINSGHSDAFELMGTLTTTSSFLTINNGSFEQDMLGSEEVTIAEFNVTVDEGIAIGTVVDMIYNIQAGEYAASKTFNTKVGLILENWETGDFAEYDWEFGGNADWNITDENPYEGTYCAKSGNISDQQNSELSLTYDVMADDTISFFYKVSSEASYDYLQFYIDNNMMGQWAGEVGWERAAYPVTAGPHIFTWVYDKDYSVSNGQDCGWIDFISFPPELATTAYAGPDASICEDEECPLTGSATNYISVEWSTSGTGIFDDNTILTPVYTPGEEDINAGEVTLTLMVYGPSREDVSDDMTLTIITAPTAYAGDDASICEGEEFAVTMASAENYSALLWSTTGDGTFNDATILLPVYTPGENDILEENVILMLTASNQPCLDAVSEFTIDINPLPSPEVSGAEAACQYVEGIIYTTPMAVGSSFYWEITGGEILEGQETNEISVVWNEPGEGLLTLTETNDETLCESTVDYPVTVNEVPVPLISGNDDVCMGEADVIYNTSFVEGHTYEWSITGGVITAGANANEVTVTWEEVGQGGLVVTETISETGCMETGSMTVNVNPLPTINLNDTSMCHNHIITLDAGNPDAQSWEWSTGETTQTIEVDSSGVGFSGTKDISVIVTSANDCVSEKSIVVTIDDCSGIAENLYKLDVNLFPNPNTGTFTIELKAGQNDLLNLKIVDARGAVVFEEKEVHLHGIHTKSLSLNNLQEGIYYLLIDSDKVRVVKKVVIQR